MKNCTICNHRVIAFTSFNLSPFPENNHPKLFLTLSFINFLQICGLIRNTVLFGISIIIGWLLYDSHVRKMSIFNKRPTVHDGHLSTMTLRLTVNGSHFCILSFSLESLNLNLNLMLKKTYRYHTWVERGKGIGV